jgi:uncharacterized protein
LSVPRWEQDERALGPIVQGFTAEGFLVDGRSYRAVLLTPERAEAWAPPPIEELTLAHLGHLLPADRPPEFLILGTGKSMAFPPRAVVREIEARGIGSALRRWTAAPQPGPGGCSAARAAGSPPH